MKFATVETGMTEAPRPRGVERWASRTMVSGARQRYILSTLWMQGKLNRRNLQDLTGIRPNTVGLDIGTLLECRILRELAASAGGRGRPGVPLEIDEEQRDIVGLAIEPDRVSVARLNLVGRVLQSQQVASHGDPMTILDTARMLLTQFIGKPTVAIGLSVTGSIDPINHYSLYGSAWPGAKMVSLEGLYEIGNDTPVVLENDMHALAARWLLMHKSVSYEDVLLVHFKDGQFGASLLVEGRPNRGCIGGANELGHTRLSVETEECHCGRTGCLERICSTAFVNRLDPRPHNLMQRAENYDGTDTAMKRMIELLSMGIANAVNFTRVHRLVLISEMMHHTNFSQALIQSIEQQLVPDIAGRVQVEVWQQIACDAAETAGWLGLANLFLDGWGTTGDLADC